MLLKLLGALFVVAACGWAGSLAAKKLYQRVTLLDQIDQGLALLSTQIDYGLTPLPQALLQTARSLRGQSSAFFAQAAQVLIQGDGITAEEAWDQSLECFDWELADFDLLRRLGQGLGLSGKQDQLKRLEATRRLLAENRRKAKEEAEGYGKVWRSLGWGGGLVIALFLL